MTRALGRLSVTEVLLLGGLGRQCALLALSIYRRRNPLAIGARHGEVS